MNSTVKCPTCNKAFVENISCVMHFLRVGGKREGGRGVVLFTDGFLLSLLKLGFLRWIFNKGMSCTCIAYILHIL